MLLTKSQQSITKQRKSRKIAPCKNSDGVVVNLGLSLRVNTMDNYDGAVTSAACNYVIKEYYGKETFVSPPGCCVISFGELENDGAFLAEFKKSDEGRSEYESGNCCCILSQECKFTFHFFPSLSMFWCCSRVQRLFGDHCRSFCTLLGFSWFIIFCSILFK